ncbi:MAG: hypothetical protein QOG23_1354 [Blastocatellia bacterium]|jgi:hypothetical protein|nr:hypothetical protein [Blastocatellia bacterium]
MKKAVFALIFIGLTVLTTIGAWHVSGLTNRGSAKTDLFADDMNAQIRRGIGSQVRFASPNSSNGEVRASVQSAGNFIYARSGFKMSPETENRLVDLEQQTLKGERPRIKPETLINATTDIGLASLSALSDKEIDDAVNRNRGSSLYSAADLRVARDRHVKGDPIVRSTVKLSIQQKVNDRLTVLGRAMPEQFSRAKTEGFTPVQALLVEYSIASDDLMAGSTGDVMRKGQNSRSAEGSNQKSDQKSERPFGLDGRFASTRLDLFLNKQSSRTFLDRIEKEGKE